MCRDISVHTEESYVFWYGTLYFSHEGYECCVIIWFEFSSFPDTSEFRVRCYDEWIYFDLIRTKALAAPHFMHRCLVDLWCRSDKPWHHVGYHLESCILKELGSSYRLSISMTTLVELVDRVISCLISYLDTSDAISAQPDDLFFIDPVWTRFDGDTDDSRSCRFILFLGFFEGD